MSFVLTTVDGMEIQFGPTERVVWPSSFLTGIMMCKIVYEATGYVSSQYFKGYAKLSKLQQIEWNNRGFSTIHAIVVAIVSFYLVVVSDVFKDGSHEELIMNRKSALSDAIFGISLGYFVADLGMILWFFPRLGGKEYLIHHALSMYAIFLALLSGQAHYYILMVLFTEVTTPFINLRWYLDLAGQKNTKVYIWNGIAMAIGWLVARILLFIYFFSHMYLHFDQLKTMFTLGLYSLVTVPSLLAVMNVFWFWKILRGMKKAISRKAHKQ